jgi:glutathionylspermidine synthase
MQRHIMTPRPDWQTRCDQVGFTFYDMASEDGRPYWNESAAYSFSPEEIDVVASATQELVYRTFDAAEHIVRAQRFLNSPYQNCSGVT